MSGRSLDLSGRWSGVYFYPRHPMGNPDDTLPATPFVADLTDHSGRVSGRTEEPDYFNGPGAPAIPATLEGHRTGGVLTFTKTPQGGGQRHTIDYVGHISADGMLIEGRWTIHGQWSGDFRMQRSANANVRAVEREASV